GFRKVDPDRWEFAHKSFLRGQKQLLGSIRRRRSPHQGNAGSFSHGSLNELCIKYDLENFKKEKDAIVTEVVQLKKEQEDIDKEMEDMKRRLDLAERKPQQMISFLSTVIDNPDLITQRLQNRASLSGGKKRRRLLHKEPEENSPTFQLDGFGANALLADGFMGTGLIADGFEIALMDIPHIDSKPIGGLISEELTATSPLINENPEMCIKTSEFGIDVGCEEDDSVVSNLDDILWD
ncbi:hypothetical protein KI387_011998, partial [Taxus chinensis]